MQDHCIVMIGRIRNRIPPFFLLQIRPEIHIPCHFLLFRQKGLIIFRIQIIQMLYRFRSPYEKIRAKTPTYTVTQRLHIPFFIRPTRRHKQLTRSRHRLATLFFRRRNRRDPLNLMSIQMPQKQLDVSHTLPHRRNVEIHPNKMIRLEWIERRHMMNKPNLAVQITNVFERVFRD